MQVTETAADGLKREFRIVVPAGELEEKVTDRLGEIGRSIVLPGFRPGKVPMQILRRRFGNSVLGEVLESTVQGSTAEAIREGERPILRIAIDDDGPGLPDDARDAMLKRGQRLDETKPGSGLGLSIVVDLAALYRGTLTLVKSPLGGLRTTLDLPGDA